jgi:hypothetical protein
MPRWLSWFGAPYRDLVTPHLTCPKRRLRKNPVRHIEQRRHGIFLRLGDEPRPRKGLGAWPLPREPPTATRRRVIPDLRR